MPFFNHQFDHLIGHIDPHVIIQTPPGKDDLRVIADFLCFIGQIVGIDADTVAADKSRTKRQKIPFCPCCFKNRVGIDTEFIENDCQFVHKCDIDITLRIFDDFCRFGHFDRRNEMGSRGDNAGIKCIDFLPDLRSTSAGNLFDFSHCMLFISRINPFRAVTAEEIDVKFQSAEFFEDGNTLFFGTTGINGTFINNHIIFFQHFSDRFARFI